ncbi:leucyl aminopeptidase [Nitrosomonas sp. HPC101]|uniref:leucyl aminopeptidase n=1 Tax=Nitrosomonas sp. HPC101 TaxID=1658667 RepID=UPI00136A4977|nr:leucyl aminopeptidase [Nitrosomonas sp. HPC101]MXS85020.1 leucyl aminopeptidase [Nitrosomonas sp. HPC101]
MDFVIQSGRLEKYHGDCIVAGVFETRKLTGAAKTLDEVCKGYLAGVVDQGDMDGRANTTLLLHNVPGIGSKRVLLVGLGKEEEYAEKEFLGAIRAVFKALQQTGVKNAGLCVADLIVEGRGIAWALLQSILLAEESVYRFDRLKSKREERQLSLQKITFLIGDESATADAKKALQQGVAIARGINVTKDLGNLAPNICTPTYLAEQAGEMARTYSLKLSVLEEKDMEKLGMGALLAVARGSHQPAKLIVMEYRGRKSTKKPVVLVGKGVTFDTGGISLKPAAEMDEMKYDMGGAASVFGTLTAVAEMKLPVNVTGIIPATENMPGGNATKPGDVVTSLSGQTIEILNTDAEGRLILCDALAYAERYKPEVVIDIATLTGACVVALGHVVSGLMGTDEQLVQELRQAGEKASDRAWQLPLGKEYQELLKSNFADMANIGGRWGGAITAACFLSRFTGKYRWAHLDIAGTAWKSGKEKEATGRPVPLLTQFLIDRADPH